LTVLCSPPIDDVPLGVFRPPKYDSRSLVFARIGLPPSHSVWQA
jgi:hypothetical protein